MKIYVAHSKDIDYKSKLYQPLRNCKVLKNEQLIFPHEISKDSYNTRDFYKSLDLFIAEVSIPATGLGIELGWAYDDNLPIYCLYKKGKKPSSSIYSITDQVLEYQNEKELVEIFL